MLPSGDVFCWTADWDLRHPESKLQLWEKNSSTGKWFEVFLNISLQNITEPGVVFDDYGSTTSAALVLGAYVIYGGSSFVEFRRLMALRHDPYWDYAEREEYLTKIHSLANRGEYRHFRILLWDSDGALELRDGVSGRLARRWFGHDGAVWGALTLADGRFVTWSEDRTLRLWNQKKSQPGPVLEGHTWGVLGALQLADQRIITWSLDSTVRAWHLPAEANAGEVTNSLRPACTVAYYGVVTTWIGTANSEGRAIVCSDDGEVIPVFLHIGTKRASFSDLL